MTEEEMQELERLRQEKRTREQTQRAETALHTAGVPAVFAALLAGCDDADTDRRTAAFCQNYQAALSEDIRTRLPERAPVIVEQSAPRAKRGIQRLR